ncbi:MAG: SEC-C domain-containing protein [Candidatus Bathyarchaeota archaeon]|uniref:YecA family protein n=1 Tax=Candidatus Bathycorpusculum sp. TaxID=2994959 RepID=UPI00281BC28D|nr:SEC-C domain-containing protein [Candidatus Termiticorpusculum sp.]MCL2257553.1 SEC-C domain-containing protein [Candidatus Termiticorpusculum sp.]MCL2292313.1 SEC-C domain-containing protein [Candidatus Termiticorpusculum sp.]
MKIGRNELCPCGSGQKYKKCCLLRGVDPFEVTSTKTRHLRTVRNMFDVNTDDDLDAEDIQASSMNNLHILLLRNRPHIKEYTKMRKMHSRILNSMLKYYYNGKFEQKIDQTIATQYRTDDKESDNNVNTFFLLESNFDMETSLGSQAFIDTLAYKTSPNLSCITEEFIKNNHYKRPEKIEFLHSMLDAKLGLFDVTKIDSTDGYAYITEIFTGQEYKITDIGLSGSSHNYDNHYIYTRIFTHHGISYSTGLNFMFSKKDTFIQEFIERHKKNYKTSDDIIRFTELYNRFSNDHSRIKIIRNSF